jgi:hypothetical protein
MNIIRLFKILTVKQGRMGRAAEKGLHFLGPAAFDAPFSPANQPQFPRKPGFPKIKSSGNAFPQYTGD